MRTKWGYFWPVLFGGLLTGGAPAGAQGLLEQMEKEVAAVVRQARGGVVTIEDERAYRSSPEKGGSKLLPDKTDPGTLKERDNQAASPGRDTKAPPTKIGTGFVIEGGYVVTTADVLEGMQRPLVLTDKGVRYRANIVLLDAELNIGMLRLPNSSDLPPMKFGDSKRVTPGHFAILIGNQGGQVNSASLTFISAVRSEGAFAGNHFYPGLIQFAGTVGAGTSGAPLLNSKGEVIGMFVAVPSGEATPATPPAGDEKGTASETKGGGDTGQPAGRTVRSLAGSAGYALPIHELRLVVEDVRNIKGMARGWVGIGLREDSRVVEQGDQIKIERTLRADVIYPDSPAARGGLEPGDLLLSLNRKPVSTMADFRTIAVQLHRGDVLEVVVQRSSGKKTFKLNIVGRPPTVKPPAGKGNN